MHVLALLAARNNRMKMLCRSRIMRSLTQVNIIFFNIDNRNLVMIFALFSEYRHSVNIDRNYWAR